MNQAPLAADALNVDLHQGDWEHLDVLLNPATLTPEWLYMARHSGEGQFIQWGSRRWPSTAPLVQAALGGHPTYDPGCGAQIRHQPSSALEDWPVCGSGRFAFRASATPLVDLAWMPWACWRGHFGAAGTRDEAGPRAPILQAENRLPGSVLIHRVPSRTPQRRTSRPSPQRGRRAAAGGSAGSAGSRPARDHRRRGSADRMARVTARRSSRDSDLARGGVRSTLMA